MADRASKQEVVNRNFEAFQKELPTLVTTHPGKFALIRDEKIVEFFDTIGDAVKHAQSNYSDDLYSVQQVTHEVEDLGYFSHAVA